MRLMTRLRGGDASLQRGDTIIEVLIAIAIVSLILAGAYASTNHNVRAIQDTQEHSQALQLVQTQVEFLGAQKSLAGGTGCFDARGVATSTCNFKADGSTDTAHDQPEYKLQITKPGSVCTSSYQVTAIWDSTLGPQDNVTVCYRPQAAG